MINCVVYQLSLLSVGLENVHLPSAELCQNVHEASCALSSCISGTRRQWSRGQLEFEAMMRQLDVAVCIAFCSSSSFTHASLGLCSVKRRHQSPEWKILSHVNCFIQGGYWISGLAG